MWLPTAPPSANAATPTAREARHWFDIFTDNCFTPGKMVPKFTGERPTTGLGTRMITLNTAQEMRKYLGDDDGFYTGWTDRCINDLRTLFMKPDIQAVMEVVGTDGSIIDHFDERTLNPGHTTEGGSCWKKPAIAAMTPNSSRWAAT